ncbi:MAG: class I SAM-dependent methyltransferase [Betaproteobacteria bacterium]|nr:class I SAM-dependent methyltransferase [Betaproteobacteria bacterium]
MRMRKALKMQHRGQGPPAVKRYTFPADIPIPDYLRRTYWWAYLNPRGVRFFERQWLVNLILWGNYRRLRDAALAELGFPIRGKVLQVACVYGDFTERVARRLGPQAHMDVIDVAPVQLDNLKRKIKGHRGISLHRQDSVDLAFADGTYDYVVVYFLLHEQPGSARIRTIGEAMRVVRPGGKVIFVDYHQPSPANPMRYVMTPVLTLLEPFAMDMWVNNIADWLPAAARPAAVEKHTYFGGLYQKVVVTA